MNIHYNIKVFTVCIRQYLMYISIHRDYTKIKVRNQGHQNYRVHTYPLDCQSPSVSGLSFFQAMLISAPDIIFSGPRLILHPRYLKIWQFFEEIPECLEPSHLKRRFWDLHELIKKVEIKIFIIFISNVLFLEHIQTTNVLSPSLFNDLLFH